MKEFNLYNFNYKYELKTHKYIGADYNPRGIYKLFSWFRKQFKDYKICNKYTEWKNHAKEQIPTGAENYSNFLHWLVQQKREGEIELFMKNTVLIPIYTVILAEGDRLLPVELEQYDKPIFMMILLISILIFSMVILYKQKEKNNFWNDYIEITEEIGKNGEPNLMQEYS